MATTGRSGPIFPCSIRSLPLRVPLFLFHRAPRSSLVFFVRAPVLQRRYPRPSREISSFPPRHSFPRPPSIAQAPPYDLHGGTPIAKEQGLPVPPSGSPSSLPRPPPTQDGSVGLDKGPTQHATGRGCGPPLPPLSQSDGEEVVGPVHCPSTHQAILTMAGDCVENRWMVVEHLQTYLDLHERNIHPTSSLPTMEKTNQLHNYR